MQPYAAVGKQELLPILCVCSLSHLALNAHAPYCHLWPVRLFYVLPHYLINGTKFREKVLTTKRVFWFSLQLLLEICQSRRNWARYDHKRILVFQWSTCYSSQNLTELKLSRHIFEKYVNVKFYILLTVHRVMILGKWPTWRTIFLCISLYF